MDTDLLTNFAISDYPIYKEAVETFGDKTLRISKEARDCYGNQLFDCFSLRTEVRKDRSAFWGLFKSIQERVKNKPSDIRKDCIDTLASYMRFFGTYHTPDAYMTSRTLKGNLFNVVFVTHDEDAYKKKYLFGVAENVSIKIGDKLFADTRNDKKLVTAVTCNFKVDRAGLDAMDIIFGAKGELKMIVARAMWTEVKL
jgi:hypothetical protein